MHEHDGSRWVVKPQPDLQFAVAPLGAPGLALRTLVTSGKVVDVWVPRSVLTHLVVAFVSSGRRPFTTAELSKTLATFYRSGDLSPTIAGLTEHGLVDCIRYGSPDSVFVPSRALFELLNIRS